MFYWPTAIWVFLAYLAVDALYAVYTHSVAKGRAAVAATTGAVMYVCLAYGVKAVVDSMWYVIPIAAGSWLGTYFTIKHLNK